MLDKKTTTVLQTLGKLGGDSAYKVITVEEVLSSLPQKVYDIDSVKETIDFLNKQEYIVIKFEEDFTFCYSLLPKARIFLETEINKGKAKPPRIPFYWVFLAGVFSGLVACVVNIEFNLFIN